MATTREVRRGASWLRLHQFVLLRSRRNIRSTVGNLELSSEEHKTDPEGHEGRHQSNLRCVRVARPCERSLAELHLCAWDDAANLVDQRPLDRGGGREQARDDRHISRRDDRGGVTWKLPDLLLHPRRTVCLVRREVCQRTERDVGEGVNELLEGQHAGRQSSRWSWDP